MRPGLVMLFACLLFFVAFTWTGMFLESAMQDRSIGAIVAIFCGPPLWFLIGIATGEAYEKGAVHSATAAQS